MHGLYCKHQILYFQNTPMLCDFGGTNKKRINNKVSYELLMMKIDQIVILKTTWLFVKKLPNMRYPVYIIVLETYFTSDDVIQSYQRWNLQLCQIKM